MDAPLDLSPLELHCEADLLRFQFKTQEGIYAELPADFETLLASQLAEVLQPGTTWRAEIDLQDVSGLSSRELGSLIALQKVLRPRFDRVPIVNVSHSVRHLLEITRTDQFFDF